MLLAGITRLDQESLDLLPPYALGQTLEEILDYLRLEKEKLDYQKLDFNHCRILFVRKRIRSE